jgi:hypothetical protein
MIWGSGRSSSFRERSQRQSQHKSCSLHGACYRVILPEAERSGWTRQDVGQLYHVFNDQRLARASVVNQCSVRHAGEHHLRLRAIQQLILTSEFHHVIRSAGLRG